MDLCLYPLKFQIEFYIYKQKYKKQSKMSVGSFHIQMIGCHNNSLIGNIWKEIKASKFDGIILVWVKSRAQDSRIEHWD